MTGATPWPEMMRTAVRLGLTPEAFWRLSLVEWRWLTATPPGDAPLGRVDLERLSVRWPD